MSSHDTPNLENLRDQFAISPKTPSGAMKQVSMLPMLIKDPLNKMWIYGRCANGLPQLTEVTHIEKYTSLSFPIERDLPVKISENTTHQAVYNDLTAIRGHYYNYKVLVKDAEQKRIAELDKLTKEFDRQYKAQQLTNKQLEEDVPTLLAHRYQAIQQITIPFLRLPSDTNQHSHKKVEVYSPNSH
jgi:hypothetical protein